MSAGRLRTEVLALFLVMAFVAVFPSESALAEVVLANDVNIGNTISLLPPVPVGSPAQVFYLKSIVVSNPNLTVATCASILRSNMAVTPCIVVPADNTVQIKFDPPIAFIPGEKVQVRNGSSAGPLHFTVIGVRDVR